MRTISDLMEELILLDEVAGELDDDSNAINDRRRAELIKQIKEIEQNEVDSNIVRGYN